MANTQNPQNRKARRNQQTVDIDAILPISWPRDRLHASLTAKKAEHRIYGPIDRVINDLFPARRPHTQQGGWMLKPQPSLRERQAGVEPVPGLESDTEDENEEPIDEDEDASYEEGEGDTNVGNTTIDSQNNPVQGDRKKAKRPDFVVAKATRSPTNDVHHLYIEVKNGSATERQFLNQMAKYLRLAARAIPPVMTLPVYFMLINGEETLLWTLKRDTVYANSKTVIKRARRMTTMGQEWWALVIKVADRA